MKKILGLSILASLVAGAVAWAAVGPTPQDQLLWFRNGILVMPNSLKAIATATSGSKVTRILGGSGTVNFAAASDGLTLSSSITVTGAQAGDPCFVGVPTAAAALQAEFGCYVDAADSAKVWFRPTARTVTTCTLNGASPSVCTGTVIASSICQCSPVGATAAIGAGGCAVDVATTTATVTAANSATHVVNLDCVAPVDPASGTFYVRVISSQ